jgi:hypothetical protein
MTEKTILGVRLRRIIITFVNGMGRGKGIRVYFRGRRAYTNGTDINLPAIRDLAEIPYPTARALIGYSIHEVAHIRETDFNAIIRAINEGRMEPDDLIKKFENAIEDYRIERITAQQFPGSVDDLTALRNMIHPSLSWLRPEWMADPRACGPLALTWTGSLLNGFNIPAVMPTLNEFPAPVRALIDNWTMRMDGVVDTDAVIELAIAFAKEAMDYADASRSQNNSKSDASDDDDADADDAGDEGDADEADGDQDQQNDAPSQGDASADDQDQDPSGPAETSEKQNDDADGDVGNAANATASEEAEAPNSDGEDTPSEDASSSKQKGKLPNSDDGDGEGSENASQGQSDPDDINDQSDSGDASSSDKTSDDDADGNASGSSDPKPSQAGDNDQNDPATSGKDSDAEQRDSSDGADADESDPFADVLDENAAFDDFIDDLRDAIAAHPLPEEMPETIDGEVDPDEIVETIDQANSVAPNYTSPDPDPAGDQPQANRAAAAHHYDDTRFIPVDQSGEEESLLPTIMAEAAGVIGTTARTIRRLLMSEERKGTHRNRRDGNFDIRNISAIVRQTGQCYKKAWERPAPETHLTILGDFSGSMLSGRYDPFGSAGATSTPLSLAVTGMFAVSEATRNTSIETSIYGYTGYSPNVTLYAFKEGKQSQIATRRKIGNYSNLPCNCTPTGEAMAAVAELLEDVTQKRRILLVMTDGDADNPKLCEAVIDLLERRGVEVVAIGINHDSVRKWCRNSHVIQDISQLPQALLACIDPRAGKKSVRKAA